MSALKCRSFLKKSFRNYVRRAQLKCVEWSLTFEQFKELCFRNCTYCGQSPTKHIWKFGTKGNPSYGHYVSIEKFNGIDRFENSHGYTLANSVTCCGTCNAMKSSLSADEFLARALAIVKHQGLK